MIESQLAPVTSIIRRLPNDADARDNKSPKQAGEREYVSITVDARTVAGLHSAQEAVVSSDQADAERWHILNDEPSVGGERQLAPSPLMYLASGRTFALLSHISTAAELLELEPVEIKLRQHFSFSMAYPFGAGFPRHLLSGSTVVETTINVRCSNKQSDFDEFADWCARAFETFNRDASGPRTTVRLFLNGRGIVLGHPDFPPSTFTTQRSTL